MSESPEDLVEVIKPEIVSWSLLKPVPVDLVQVKLLLSASFVQVVEALRQELGDVAPSELLSHLGNDTTMTELASIEEL